MKLTTEKMSVTQAYLDGEKIEYKHVVYQDSEWKDCSHPVWEWGNYDYRVKQEQKLVAYSSADELREAMKAHGPFIVSKTDKEGHYFMPTSISNYTVHIGVNTMLSVGDLLHGYTWEDGTPCGKIEEK